MSRPIDRRTTLALAATLGLPAHVRAQTPPAPSPSATPPASTPMVPPAPAVTGPAAAPAAVPAQASPVARPPAASTAAIDKTKIYFVFLDQTIDVASMRNLRRQMANLVTAGVTQIKLVIDSAGGSVEPMLITYSFLRALPARIDTHAQGFVQSAATILFLAGESRTCDRTARFVFHPTQSTLSGVLGEQQLQERMGTFDDVKAIFADILHDRTRVPETDIARFNRELVTYPAQRALETGVVDAVADLRIPGDDKARMLFLD